MFGLELHDVPSLLVTIGLGVSSAAYAYIMAKGKIVEARSNITKEAHAEAVSLIDMLKEQRDVLEFDNSALNGRVDGLEDKIDKLMALFIDNACSLAHTCKRRGVLSLPITVTL